MIVCKGWQDDTTQGKEWEKLLFGDEVVSEWKMHLVGGGGGGGRKVVTRVAG
jgi:hypothetical protein